jgi:hypothetical protein
LLKQSVDVLKPSGKSGISYHSLEPTGEAIYASRHSGGEVEKDFSEI